MNLHDVVPLKKAAKAQKVADTEVLGKAMEAAQLFKQLGLQVPRELYETVGCRAARNAQGVLGCLTPEERTILLTLMAKLASNVNLETR